jgi:hypothetical protein
MQPLRASGRYCYVTRNKWFLHEGRSLEIRDRRVMTSFEIWVYENDRPLGRHSIVSLREAATRMAAGEDALSHAMDGAIGDIRAGRFAAGA